jgi:hypothetical protein
MSIEHKDPSPYSFPSQTEMLAAFGVEPEFEEFFQSFTYRFRSRETELVVTYGEWMGRYVAVSMTVRGESVFHVDMPHVLSIRIMSERDVRWLQVSFESERNMPDMHICLEPTLRCEWITPPSRRDTP